MATPAPPSAVGPCCPHGTPVHSRFVVEVSSLSGPGQVSGTVGELVEPWSIAYVVPRLIFQYFRK